MFSRKGFTLIELLVVISIIALLSSVVLSSLNTARAKARDARRQSDIAEIRNALELYRNDNGAYPISGGATAPNGAWMNSNDASWNSLATVLSPYIKVLPHDPKESPSDSTTGPWPGNAGYTSYAYYSGGTNGCTAGQWYMIVFQTEVTQLTSQGVKLCDGTTYGVGAPKGVVSGQSQK